PVLTDVNVHPTKLEIRFSKDKELIELIEQAIAEHLRNIDLIPKIERQEKHLIDTRQDSFHFNHEKNTKQFKSSSTVEASINAEPVKSSPIEKNKPWTMQSSQKIQEEMLDNQLP